MEAIEVIDYALFAFTKEEIGNFVDLKDVFIERGELYQKLSIDIFMCRDFKKACDLGDCEMFNQYCE